MSIQARNCNCGSGFRLVACPVHGTAPPRMENAAKQPTTFKSASCYIHGAFDQSLERCPKCPQPVEAAKEIEAPAPQPKEPTMSSAIKNWKYERSNVRSELDNFDPLKPISIFNRHTGDRIETFNVYRDMGRALNATLDLLDRKIKPRASNPSNEWQDISSAPKDGQWYLVHHADWSEPVIARSMDFGWVGSGCGACSPTHWMPLPTPPDHPVEAAKDSVCEGCGEYMRECACHEPGRGPAAQTPDRTEGEGPYRIEHRDSGVRQFRNRWVTGPGVAIQSSQWFENENDLPEMTTVAYGDETLIDGLNAAYAEGQASTHPRIERLERIEGAAKAVVDAAMPVSAYWSEVGSVKVEALAALLDDEGDGAK